MAISGCYPHLVPGGQICCGGELDSPARQRVALFGTGRMKEQRAHWQPTHGCRGWRGPAGYVVESAARVSDAVLAEDAKRLRPAGLQRFNAARVSSRPMVPKANATTNPPSRKDGKNS